MGRTGWGRAPIPGRILQPRVELRGEWVAKEPSQQGEQVQVQSALNVPLLVDLEDPTTWRRKWQPTAVFLPGKPHEQRSLARYSS